MLTIGWILLLLIFSYLLFFHYRISWKAIPQEVYQAFFHLSRRGSWVVLGFYGLVLFFPLVAGLEFFLKTDANVLVVIFFFFWSYQWIKIVYFSSEKIP